MKKVVFLMIFMGLFQGAHADEGFRLEEGKRLSCAPIHEGDEYRVRVSHGSVCPDQTDGYSMYVLKGQDELPVLDAEFDEESNSFTFDGGSLVIASSRDGKFDEGEGEDDGDEDDGDEDDNLSATFHYEGEEHQMSCVVLDMKSRSAVK